MVVKTHLTDAELLNMIDSSKDAAFKILYQRYWNSIRSFGLKMTRNNNVFIDDLVQDTFMALYKAKKEPDAISNLEGYLSRIIQRKVIDYLRKDERKNAYFNSLAAYASETTGWADENLIMKDFQELVRKGVDQMPEGVKQIMKMNNEQYMEKYEIAEALEISEETVKNQLYKGRKRLRSMLKLLLIYNIVMLLTRIINIFS
jgi:RNA polymerase sigma-70 factor (ECF subfamily)